jgi:probable rRNA maturation factor
MAIEVAVTIEGQGWTEALGDVEDHARRFVLGTLAQACPTLGPAEVSLLFTNDATLRTLNRTWRDKDAPTNVLSFPAQELKAGDVPVPAFAGAPLELGDVAIALETCTYEALTAGKPLGDHVDHLIVHGTLHLLGYDHGTDADATVMEGLEVAILTRFGIPDPYRSGPDHG